MTDDDLTHQIDPDQFMTVRDSNRSAATDKDVLELAREIVHHVENDPVRTTRGAAALGLAYELNDRLNGVRYDDPE